MKMTDDEYALYSAINHADDDWTPEATEVLNRIKAETWDECLRAVDWALERGTLTAAMEYTQKNNPYRDTTNV